MTIIRTEDRGTFIAKDAKGREYHVDISVDILEAASFANPDGEIEGLLTLTTSDGDHVNKKIKGIYEVLTVSGSVEITSTDASAP